MLDNCLSSIRLQIQSGRRDDSVLLMMLEGACPPDHNIEDAIIRMGKGDESAVEELYVLIKDSVYAYALSKLGDPADAEDVLHDTFVKLYRYSPRYIPEGKPMAWIITITGNIAKRHRELKLRHISYDDAVEGEEAVSAGASIEENAVHNELISALLSILSDEEREIVILHAMWGMKHREIALYLAKPISTILSKYNRAIQKLKKYAEEIE